MKTLILASGSPSRKEILEEAGLSFEVDVSNYEEDMGLDMAPKELAMHLSVGKAKDVAARHTDAVILAADSFGVYKGELLGKPHTKERAKEMLTMLSGQCHSFITGFTIIDTNSGKEYTGFDETKVYFKPLTLDEIDQYLAEEDVLEKAGAYSINGAGKRLVLKIEGDFVNVRGLPIDEVRKVFKRFGVEGSA